LVGALLILLGLGIGLNRVLFLESARHATGKVVGADKRFSLFGTRRCERTTTIEFKTGNGVLIDSTSYHSCSVSWPYEVGDRVLVFYSSEDPYDVLVEGPFGKWLDVTGLTAVGAAFSWIGLARRRGRRASTAKRALKSAGVKVVGRIVGSKPGNRRVNKVCSVILIARARHPLSGEECLVYSEDLWIPMPEDAIGREVDVYFDSDDARLYLFDGDPIQAIADSRDYA
jgi:hypothetical protein